MARPATIAAAMSPPPQPKGDPERSPTPARVGLPFLLVTAALCGALVMVVEVLGSRALGPFFGVSLFVWTALITVTLLALALGYALGGHLADRHPSPALLYALIAAAGVWVALVPLIKAPVLQATLPLGLRLGALASGLALIGPPLLLLGCVSPFIVRLAAQEWGRLGRTVGVFSAVSTAGSFVGTVCTGFFLVAHVGVSRAFVLAGLALVALGASYFVLVRRRWPAALAPLAVLALWPGAERPAVTLADGTRAAVVHAEDSAYGHIRVIDYRFGAAHQREMTIDGLVQGGVDVASGRSVYEYPYLLQWLPTALHPQGRSCVVIGVGAGIVPQWYQARGITTDVVDIDAQVVAVAQRYFGFVPRGAVFVEDARTFLARGDKAYDFVILDVFNGDTTPGHLLSLEALRQARQRLAPGGVLAANLVGGTGADAAMTASLQATLRAVFDQVVLYAAFDTGSADAGNLVAVAWNGPPRALPPAPPEAAHPLAEPLLRRSWGRALQLPPQREPALVLTDDFNPLDVRDIRVKEAVRRRILDSTPAAILVGG